MAAKTKTGTLGRGPLPTKKSINFASVGEKPIRYGLLIPLLIVVIAAAVLLAKFAVIDRLNALADERAEAARLRQEIADGYRKIDSYGELTEQYAHYTFSDMTEEELTRASRLEVVDLISRVVLPSADISAWEVKGNELTLTLTGNTLQEINLIAQSLEKEEIVDFCTVTTAATRDNQYFRVVDPNDSRVTARIVVYLNEENREVTL